MNRMAAAARDYNAAVEALNRLQTNFSVIEQIKSQGDPVRDEDLVPEMIEWIRRVGYEPKEFDKMNVLHVTGTKGKGSTCAFIQSILLQCRAAGRSNVGKVGLYTSPHLKSVRERIMIDGQPIAAEKFAKYFFQVYDRIENSSSDTNRFRRMGPGVKPNYFRYLTLVSFHAFMQEGVDSAIYEVGIGGEYDSTNVFVSPKGCGVTSLGIDHVNVLGNTIEQIAWNKAGIFKAGAAAFTIDSQPVTALAVLKERAEEKKANFKVVGVHPEIAKLTLGLAGEFQRKNATIAAHLVGARLGIELPQDKLPQDFVDGLEKASWGGRCQILDRLDTKWYIDGAHTVDSLEEAAKWFASVYDVQKPVVLLFNQQKRDNADELLTGLYNILKSLGVQVSTAIFTTNQTWSAGFQADMVSHNVSKESVDKLVVQKALAATWTKLVPECDTHVCPSLEDATKLIEKAENKQVFVTGSLLMVGGLLAVIDP